MLNTFVVGLALTMHLILAPYTKVEESFNTQAVHDLIFEQLPNFDHLEFGGVVPRTFLGPILIAGPSIIFKSFVDFLASMNLNFGFTDTQVWLIPLNDILLYIQYQIVRNTAKVPFLYSARFTMAFYTLLSTSFLLRAITKKFGARAATYFTLLMISQFHLMYYGSRLMPNTLALVIFNFALGCFINEQAKIMIALLSLAITVFRVELLFLGLSMILYKVYAKKISLMVAFLVGALSSSLSIMVSIAIDSFYWTEFTYPEFQVFLFNGVEGKSALWGLLPYHSYLTQFLPKIAPLAILYGLRLNVLSLFAAVHTVTLSLVPHKEWRFIIYVIPLLNISAATNISRLSFRQRKLADVFILISFAVSILMVLVSSLNYPGGEAMQSLYDTIESRNRNLSCNVYLDNLTCQTGATRFQQSPFCNYTKAETKDFRAFNYLIAQDKVEGFRILKTIVGYDGIELKSPITIENYLFPVKIYLAPKLLLQERINP